MTVRSASTQFSPIPPHLQTGIVTVTASDLYRQWYYRQGAFEFGFLSGWTGLNFSRRLAPRLIPDEKARQEYLDNLTLYPADMAAYVNALPLVDFEPAKMGDKGQFNYLKEWIEHNVDSEYWWKRNPKTYLHEVTIPVMHLGGMYDVFEAGTIEAWTLIQREGATPLARDNQTLFLGPWDHAEMPWANSHFDKVGSMSLGEDLSKYDHANMRLAYFDYWLKDLQRPGFDPNERVRTWTFNADKGKELVVEADISPAGHGLYEALLDARQERQQPGTLRREPERQGADQGGAARHLQVRPDEARPDPRRQQSVRLRGGSRRDAVRRHDRLHVRGPRT